MSDTTRQHGAEGIILGQIRQSEKCGMAARLLEQALRGGIAAGRQIVIVGIESNPNPLQFEVQRLLSERLWMHDEAYGRLMTKPTPRQKQGGRTYASPYYPDNCKARRAKPLRGKGKNA